MHQFFKVILMQRVALYLLGMFLYPVAAMAQQDTVTYLKDRQLQNIEVIGQRQQQRLSSAAPLQQLSYKDFKIQGITDLSDALHRLPGITLRDYGGAGGMKTVSVRGFGAQHTSVIYDGIALSDCQSGQIDLARYSLDNVESVSLVVGDQDEIFIPAREVSTAATLTIRTFQKPNDDLKPHLTAQMRVGSFGYTNPFFRFSKNLSNNFGIQAMGEYIYADNDYPFKLQNVKVVTKERRNNSRMNSGHGELSFAWTPTAASQLDGKVYYYDNDRQLPGLVHYYTNNSKETERDRNAFGQLAFKTSNRNNLWFSAKSKFNWASSSYRDGSYPDGVKDQDYWQREWYATASLLYRPIESLSLNYSGDYTFNNLNSSEPGDVHPYRHSILQSLTAKYQRDRFKMIVRGLYTISLNDAKNGTGAHNVRRLSPSISLSYQISEQPSLHLRASYKNIFRMPNFTELYFRHYGSTDLSPENTDQFNLGLTWQKSYRTKGKLTLTWDGYWNHIKDKIVAVPYNMFMWTNINVGKVRVLGTDVTFGIEQEVGRKQALRIDGNYTFQSVSNRTNPEASTYGLQIAYTPEHTGALSVSYENPWVNVSAHGTGVSKRWATNQHYDGTNIDGYLEFGLTAYRTFTIKNQKLELRGDIKNLLNKQYEIVGHYPMPGRSWQLSIMWIL